MAKAIYREYDIRGVFGRDLVRERVQKIGFHFARQLLDTVAEAKYIAVGYDARTHSPQLQAWLCSGIAATGLQVLDIGMVPTPVNYFSQAKAIDGYHADAAIMITGSHNPPEYNGFKMTLDKRPFFGEHIIVLGERIESDTQHIGDDVEMIAIGAKAAYIDFMVSQFSHLDLVGKRFVFDCGNGVAGVVLGEILARLGIEHHMLYETPDGTFPNHHPDPGDEANLVDVQRILKSGDFDLGFAYDGDADRLAVLSNKYNFKGDILALCFAKHMQNPTVIGEVKCSQVMYDEINRIGRAIMYKAGHSNIKMKIRETGADLGTEVSGHMFFNDRYFGYDDAIYSTFRVLELLADGVDLNAIYEALPSVFTTPELMIDADDANKFGIIKTLAERIQQVGTDFPTIKEVIDIDGLRIVFANGWGLVRASNTTPKLVMRFEANTETDLRRYQAALTTLIEDVMATD